MRGVESPTATLTANVDEASTSMRGVEGPTAIRVVDRQATGDRHVFDVVESTVDRAIQQTHHDPAFHSNKRLTAQDINVIMKDGPSQPPLNFSFPNVNGRSFQAKWFFKILPDNTMNQRRTWLSYSVSTSSAFCMPCMLFGGPLASRTWTCDGWQNWSSGSRDIDRHEMSKEHRASEIARLQWLAGRSLDHTIRKTNNLLTAENRNILSCVIDCVQYLAQEMMGFLGHDSRGGKLQNLFRLLAKYSPPAAAYIERIDRAHESDTKMSMNFLSPSNVQLLLSVMRDCITQQISAAIVNQKKCSIIQQSEKRCKESNKQGEGNGEKSLGR